MGFLGRGSETPSPAARGSGERSPPEEIWILEHFETSEILLVLRTVRCISYITNVTMEMEKWIGLHIFVAAVCSNAALHPEPGDPRPKPGEFGSNPDSWQRY